MSDALGAPSTRSDTLRKRYLAKLSANMFGLGISLVSQSLILRGLQPKAYGDFSYLTNVSTQIVTFFDMGTSLGFYTKLSQRQRETGLVAFYFAFSAVIAAIVLILVGLSHIAGVDRVLWPAQPLVLIYLAIGWALLNWFLQTINNMGDAHGLTVPIEAARVIQKVLGLVLIFALVRSSRLDLTSFFFYNYFVTCFLIIAILWIVWKAGHFIGDHWRLTKTQVSSYRTEFVQYSRPLFLYLLVSSIVAALDRWFLQVFSGSVEQGYFGMAVQIGAVCFLITNSVATLIIREFSIAYAKNDLAGIGRLFRRYIPLFYGIAAFLSCFIAAQAQSVADVFGGPRFHDAAFVIALVALYQIHQTYGMLSGSIFMATGQTSLYSKITITTALIGVPLGYIMMAPKGQMGFHAGAPGLAIKMLLVQFIAVNLQLYFNCRFLQLNFWRYFGHQIASLGVLLAVSAAATLVVNKVLAPDYGATARFLLSGVLYTSMVAGVLYVMPLLFGLQRKDLSLRSLLPLPK
jgi:O-antigen/teichoic acid export membrane protein